MCKTNAGRVLAKRFRARKEAKRHRHYAPVTWECLSICVSPPSAKVKSQQQGAWERARDQIRLSDSARRDSRPACFKTQSLGIALWAFAPFFFISLQACVWIENNAGGASISASLRALQISNRTYERFHSQMPKWRRLFLQQIEFQGEAAFLFLTLFDRNHVLLLQQSSAFSANWSVRSEVFARVSNLMQKLTISFKFQRSCITA